MESSSIDKANDESASSMNKRVLSPNCTTVEAIEAARRGELVEIGSPEDAIEELNRDD